MKTFEDSARQVAQDIAELVIRKHKDYGTGNILKNVVDPEIVLAVRLHEKITRLVNLKSKNSVAQNESITDTADDIIGLGIVLKMVLEGTFENRLEVENNISPEFNQAKTPSGDDPRQLN